MDAILIDSALTSHLASFLPSSSLAACARVSKPWNSLWTPYLYRHITLAFLGPALCFSGYNDILEPVPVDTVPTGPEIQAWVKDAPPTSLQKHGHHIRTLSANHLSLLRSLVRSGNCTNLSSLWLPLLRTDLWTWAQTGPQSLNSINLDPQLRVMNGDGDSQPVRMELEEGRAAHRHMQTRRWGSSYSLLPGDSNDGLEMNGTVMSAQGPSCKNLLIALLRQNPGLQKLAVTDSFPFHHSQVLKAIGELPKLTELYLFNRNDTKVDDSAVRYLLRKVKPHLKKLAFSLSYGGPLEPEFEEGDESKSSGKEDEEQELDNWDVISSASDTMDIDDDNSNKNKKRQGMKHTSEKGAALRELLLEGDMHGREGPVWTPFLSECSRLQKLRVGLFLESFFGPLVRSLQQAQSFHLCDLELGHVYKPSFLLDSDLAWLLSLASRPGWKRIRLTHFSGFGQRSMDELMKHTSTLEHLTIQFCGSILIGPMVSTLMTKFHELKHLQIEFDPNTQDSEFDASISARAIADGEQWVCDKLEYLMIQIKGVPRPDLLEEVTPASSGSVMATPSQEQPTITPTASSTVLCPSMEELEAESQNLQQCVYEQLGYLTELRELHLTNAAREDYPQSYNAQQTTYRTPKPRVVNNKGRIMKMITRERRHQREQNDCLAFTIDSGLDFLMRLNKLKVVNLTGMRHQIGLAELEWMSEHWTALKKIQGLFWDNASSTVLKCTHPEMQQFLEQKPEWVYTASH